MKIVDSNTIDEELFVDLKFAYLLVTINWLTIEEIDATSVDEIDVSMIIKLLSTSVNRIYLLMAYYVLYCIQFNINSTNLLTLWVIGYKLVTHIIVEIV